MLRDDYITSPHPRRLAPGHPSRAEIMQRHAAAIVDGLPSYRDPSSDLSVFTAEFLAQRGWCCESGCRHCPYVI